MSIGKHVGTHTVLFSLCLKFSITITTTIMIKKLKDWKSSSMTGCLPSVYKALPGLSIASVPQKNNKNQLLNFNKNDVIMFL